MSKLDEQFDMIRGKLTDFELELRDDISFYKKNSLDDEKKTDEKILQAFVSATACLLDKSCNHTRKEKLKSLDKLLKTAIEESV